MHVPIDLKLYTVRSKDGKWLRTKGYNGYGDNWVDDIQKAKIYTRIGPARSQVTWWSNNYPDYGIPDLIELPCVIGIILDENKRVKRSMDKKKQDIINQEIWRRKNELHEAEIKLAEAQKKIAELKNEKKT